MRRKVRDDHGVKNNEADLIWNRACSADPLSGTGDRHLRALLRVHAMVKSRGLDHAVAVLADEDFAAATAACGFFGLSDLAAVIATLHQAADDDAAKARLDAEYRTLVPQDQALFDAFEARLAAAPQDFAPLEPSTTDGPPPS
jgi:hypothetical protein